MTTAFTNSPVIDSPQDVEERVLKVIALTKRLPRESVTPASSFESLGIDSLDRLNILFDLESEFDIEINDEDAKRVENIPQMVAGVLVLGRSQTTALPCQSRHPTRSPRPLCRRPHWPRIRRTQHILSRSQLRPESSVRRVVITGAGVISPLGSTLQGFRRLPLRWQRRHRATHSRRHLATPLHQRSGSSGLPV